MLIGKAIMVYEVGNESPVADTLKDAKDMHVFLRFRCNIRKLFPLPLWEQGDQEA